MFIRVLTAILRWLNRKAWLVVELDDDSLHMYPLRDQVEHSADEDCVCGPTPKLLDGDDGDVWLHRHHSLDGREVREREACD